MTQMRTCTYIDRRGQIRCTECAQTVDLCLCPAPDEQAARRAGSAEGLFLRRVRDELNLADERAEPAHRTLVKLSLAAGQVSGKLLAHHNGQGVSAQEVVQELINVAVLATRLATEGDSDFDYSPSSVFGEELPTR